MESSKNIVERSKPIEISKIKWITFLPVIATVFVLAIDKMIPSAPRAGNVETPYFSYLILAVMIIFIICALYALYNKKYRAKYIPKVKFYTVLMAVICIMNFLTDKTELLQSIYFPSFNNILASGFSEGKMLFSCLIYSLRLLILGILFGGIAGVLSGIILGWSKKANYWIFPVLRFIGPVPTTIWIPMSLLIFPSLLSASVFIVALSMWFPTMVQTSSGIQNVSKGYYAVASTMGASTLYQIIHIAIPAALPQIFVGVFSGITSSFTSLMMAELMGAKYGIGWYINWKQQIMAYSYVWIGLLILALICFFVLKALFEMRKKILSWQEGIIRW